MTQRSAFVLHVCPDEAAGAYMGAQQVSTRWQDKMAPLLAERVPDAGPPSLEQIFRLG